MIRFEIRKRPKLENWVLDYEYKNISKSELDEHLRLGWTLVRKEYFIITNFMDWYKLLSAGNKIALYSLFAAILLVF